MGPPFVMIFWAILLTPIAVLIGLPLSFLGPFIYYRLRGVPREKRKCGWRFRRNLTVCFTALFVPSMCMLGLFLSFAGADNYWSYQGAFDYWRMPLEPPYELVMIDILDDAAICKWKDGAVIVGGITSYERRGSLIAGCHEDKHVTPARQGWFLFDCTSGALSRFTDEESFHTACLDRGFTSLPVMKSIRENWQSYWSDPHRRRG